VKQYAVKEEQESHQCCKELREENQRLREVLMYLASERFCTPHMRVKIFSALNPDK
jgi:hypothetical protein